MNQNIFGTIQDIQSASQHNLWCINFSISQIPIFEIPSPEKQFGNHPLHKNFNF